MIKRLMVVAGFLALAGIAGAGSGTQDAAQVPEFTLSKKLAEVQNQGAGLYNSGDKKACIQFFLKELSAARAALDDFPAYQKTITAGISKAAKIASLDDRAFALLDVVVAVREKLNALTPAVYRDMADQAWQKGQVERAGRFYLRNVNALAAKKQIPADVAATHRGVLTALFQDAGALEKRAGRTDNVKVVEDPTKNGWEVFVSFKNAPETFGRAAEAWTLDHAKDLADQIQQQSIGTGEDLSVAEIQIKGKEGDGEVKADQAPQLPDWPLIEQQFRTRTQANPKDFEPRLKDLRAAYQKAAALANNAIRTGKPPTVETQQALEQAAMDYNGKLVALEQALGGPQPLPELTFGPQTKWEDHRPGYADTKRIVYDFEKQSQEATAKQKALEAVQDKLLAQWKQAFGDRLAKQDSPDLPQREQALKESADQFGQQVKSLKKDKNIFQEMSAAIANQFATQQGQLVNKDRIAPSPDLFTGKPGAAQYKSTPQVAVLKTGPDGQPLPDDQQPPGYPKALQAAGKLAKDEKAFVDPSLRAELLPEQPNDLKAGVFGKVVGVDPKKGEITFDVDGKGTKLIYQGVDPQGIDVGDNVTPQQSIGTWRSTPKQPKRQIRIFAVNYQGQPIAPGAVLDYARQQPAAPDKLDQRPGSPPSTAPLPANGKPGERSWLEYDESMPKGIGGKLKSGTLTMSEAMAKRAVDRAKEAEDAKITAAGLLKAKLRAVNDDLKAAKDKLKMIEKDSGKALDKAKEIQQRAGELKQEFDTLKASKMQLDELAAKAKSTKNNDDIKAYNAKAKEHNLKFEMYSTEVKKFENDKTALNDRIGELGREQTRQEMKLKDLTSEKSSLESKQPGADMDVSNARMERQAKEMELRSIQMQIAQFQAAQAKKKEQDDQQNKDKQ